MFQTMIQFCVNLNIMLLNSLLVIKNFLINLPYLSIATILVAGYYTYRLMLFEIEDVKNPHIKITRKRI